MERNVNVNTIFLRRRKRLNHRYGIMLLYVSDTQPGENFLKRSKNKKLVMAGYRVLLITFNIHQGAY